MNSCGTYRYTYIYIYMAGERERRVPGGSGILSTEGSIRAIRIKKRSGGQFDHRTTTGIRRRWRQRIRRNPNALQCISVLPEQYTPVPRRHFLYHPNLKNQKAKYETFDTGEELIVRGSENVPVKYRVWSWRRWFGPQCLTDGFSPVE